MTNYPSTLVAIPCLNEVHYIERCLVSLVNSNYPKDKLNIFVVDGMSEDGTRGLISELQNKYPQIQLLDNPQRVTPIAMNIGLKAKTADIKFILGAHSTVDEDFVLNSVKLLETYPEVGCVGGVIKNIYENDVSEIIGIAMSSSFGVGNAHFRTGDAEGYVDTVAFGAYRKEVFDEVGYFDESLVRNQDDEFNYRVAQAGFKIFLSKDIKSNYFVRASYPKLARQYYQYGYWKVFVNKKYKTITSLRQLAPPVFVAGLMTLCLLGVFLPFFIWCMLIFLLLYSALALLSAVKLKKGLRKTIKIFQVFLILHFAYGWGYLVGIFDFILLNRNPKSSSSKLSR